MNKELTTKYLKNYKVFCQGEDFHSGHMFFTGNFHNHYPVYKYVINDKDAFKQEPSLELWEFIYYKENENILAKTKIEYMNHFMFMRMPEPYLIGKVNDLLLITENPEHPNIKIYNSHVINILKFFEIKNRKDIPKDKRRNILNIYLTLKSFKLPQEMIFYILSFIRIIEL